ncbi:MAG TPA: GspH/FimT family pseudopilin [Methylotenera sp.]|nr:GspH/FimT family pseudopilin [Methylotenera sp.]
MASKFKNQGVTLIELIVGIAIISIITSIAVPSFQSMLLNSQIRNAAESVANGLQKARGEAVSRNTNVTFVLGAAATGTQSSWTVNVVNPASTIASRDSSEGSVNVTRTALPATATTVTFNNLGGVVANADATATLSQIDFYAVGSNRNLRITIGGGGNTKMCDPNLASGSSPRAC